VRFGHRISSEINRADDKSNVFESSKGGENKKILCRFVAHSETANGTTTAMNHDVASKVVPSFSEGLLTIKLIWVINAKRKMVEALWIQALDPV